MTKNQNEERPLSLHERMRTISMVILAALALCYIFKVTSFVLVPLVISLFLCYMFSPVVNALKRRRVAMWLILTVIFAILTLATLGVGQLAFSSYNNFMDKEKQATYLSRAKTIAVNLSAPYGVSKVDAEKFIDEKCKDWNSLFYSPEIRGTLGSGLGTFFGFAGSVVMTLLFMIFMIVGQASLGDRFERFVIANFGNRDRARNMLKRINVEIRRFLYVKFCISIGTGVTVGVLLQLFGVDFPWLWAVLAMLLNFIPVLGPIISSIPPILLAFLMFDSVAAATVLTVLLCTIQFASGNVIEPKILGQTLNLNVIVAFVAFLFWGFIWGVPGMLLALPITAVLNVVFRETTYFKSLSILLSEHDEPENSKDKTAGNK